MPAKWKIFLVLNFTLMIPSIIGLVVLTISLFNTNLERTDDDLMFTTLFLFVFFTITLNSLLNVFIIQRYFPDKLIPVVIKRLNIVSFVLNILLSIGILVLCIYGASEEFDKGTARENNSGVIALGVILFIWIIQVIVLVMQGQLPSLISRNNRNKMDVLIDSIGH